MLDKRDKQLIQSYVDSVARVAEALGEAEFDARRDPERKGFYRRLREDLQHVNADILDTVERL